MTLQELLEALKPSQYRKLVQHQKEKYADLPDEIFKIHQAIFGDENRIYFTLDGEPEYFIKGDATKEKKESNTKIDKLIREVNSVLAGAGYIVDDINNNRAYKFFDLNTEKGKMIWSKIPEANKQDENQYKVKGHIVYIKKNEFSITKLLAANPALQKEYESYYQKAQSKNKTATAKMSDNPDDYLIVVSRHAYDIGGASTGREWRSCMNLDYGVNRRYIKYDVAGGNAVSYLIAKDDVNITHPYARVLIKKYKSRGREGHFCLFPEQTCYSELYSPIIDQYKEIIQSIIVKAQKDTFEPDLIYKFVKTKQYQDNATKKQLFINKEGGTGVTEEDQKRIKEILGQFNEDYEKMAANMMESLPVEKIIKMKKFDIEDEIQGDLDEAFRYTDNVDMRQDGNLYLRLIKAGYKSNDASRPETPSSILKFVRSYVPKLNNSNIKFETRKVGNDRKKGNDIFVSITRYELSGEEDSFYNYHNEQAQKQREKMQIVRKYDLSDMAISKNYKQIVIKYINEIGGDISATINNKNELKLEGDISFVLRLKNPKNEFVNFVEQQAKQAKEEKLKKGKKVKPYNVDVNQVSIFYRFNPNGDERADWRTNVTDDSSGFNDNMIDLGYGDGYSDVLDSSRAEEGLLKFIAKKINNGTYNFDDFFTLDEDKKKPVKEVIADLYKENNFVPNQLRSRQLEDFAYEITNSTELDSSDNNVHEFYNKVLYDINYLNATSNYFKNVLAMIKTGLISEEEKEKIIKISKQEGGSDSKKIVDFGKVIYKKYKAYLASKKKPKTDKNATNKLKEDIQLIESKIYRLKRI